MGALKWPLLCPRCEAELEHTLYGALCGACGVYFETAWGWVVDSATNAREWSQYLVEVKR